MKVIQRWNKSIPRSEIINKTKKSFAKCLEKVVLTGLINWMLGPEKPLCCHVKNRGPFM